MTTLIATDLDRTVLFTLGNAPSGGSGGATQSPDSLVLVDEIGPGYMSAHTAAGWIELASRGLVVPATTRSVQQYQRLRLPGPQPRYAIVCNGARLLVDGESDPVWHSVITKSIADASACFTTVWEKAEKWYATYDFKLVRPVEEFFVYLTVVRREPWLEDFAAQANEWASARGWRASLQGRKIYLVPAPLDKSEAVSHLAARLGVDRVLAGGDSLLDAEMLLLADKAIRPRHGELEQVGFTTPRCHVTAGRDLAAGDEIISWYLREVSVDPTPSA